MSNGGGRKIRMRFQELLATSETEFFGGDIFRLGKAVRIEEIAVAGLERNFEGRIFRSREHAEEKTVLLDGAGGAARTVNKKDRRMTGAGIAETFGVEIDENVSGGDKMRLEFAAECVIERGKNFGRISGVRGLASKCNFEHGGDKSGGDTVTCNVSDENADPFIVQEQKVIEVAGYGAHRNIAGCNLKLE